jgi:hypothetical protein
LAAWVTEQKEQRGLVDPTIRVYQIGEEGTLSLVATILGGHSKIKAWIDDALEAVVKASHIMEQTLIKNPGPPG